ncbi:hypothetical protein [Massilia glaciei]|uniref:Twin-arginine translocation pathway signal n=1 Tax=Massilia glaciei TaxID=1524097 RepID=A0A2U2HGF0_9BURK|nr:hypothetical protein [Massilia glaciei]PWF43995.1 hypothetical protein C7C56_020105 [Massilia glaciei]
MERRKMVPSRRKFLLDAVGLAAAAGFVSACVDTSPLSTVPERDRLRLQIETDFFRELQRLRQVAPASAGLIADAIGVMMFPTVVNSNPVLGEQSGMGALRVANVFTEYYLLSVIGAAGRQPPTRSYLFLFTTLASLNRFRASDPGAEFDQLSQLTIGADGRVASAAPGAPLLWLGWEGDRILPLSAQPAFSVAALPL